MTDKKAISIQINGETKQILVKMRDTLLNMLRGQLGLTGAKPGCENGDCGTCTILVNGKPIKSCLMLAIEAEGQEITTIEGLSNQPIQKAFVEKFALQCGYCTPGFILNCQALLHTHPDASDGIIEDWLGSNLCRCMGYQEVKEAVKFLIDQNPSA